MKRLLFVSLKGGCGATTVTANLAQALVKINKHVLAIDTAPANLLRLHFGLPNFTTDGWAHHLFKGLPWYEAGFESPQGAALLPFGQLSPEQRQQFDASREQYLVDLNKQTYLLDSADREQWMLFHAEMSDLNASYLTEAVASMDAVFVVVTPDAVSYTVLQSWLESNPAAEVLSKQGKLRFIANKYQPETEVGRDFMLVLKQELAGLLVPVIVHQDTALMDSVANLTTVQHYAPASQAAKDFQSLAFWCVSFLSSHQLDD